jgi:phenylacetate-CoA ligase
MTRQARRLDALLRECARNVPFYRRCWGPGLADRVAASGATCFADLPVLAKRDLLAADPTERLHRDFLECRIARECTSGSTGTPFEMPLDAASLRRRRQRFLAALLECGYRPGRRLLLVSSQPSESIKRRAGVMRRLGWHYADLDQPEDSLAESYRRTRPDILYGPLGALLQIADRSAGHLPDTRRPAVVISTGEQLSPQHQGRLEAGFGAPVADFYGMTELGLVAWRSAGRRAYHCPGTAFLLEFLPAADDPGLERLVVTDLRGGALPLVRFDTGDLVRRDRAARGQPIVEFVGRSLDSLRLPDGRGVSPYRLLTALEGITGIAEYRVLQQPDGRVDVLLHCASAAAGTAAVERVARAVSVLCPGVEVHVRPQDRPLPATAGKLRPIRSLVGTVA